MEKDSKAQITVTDETRMVVEHYLQKQWERRAKRAAKKEAAKGAKAGEVWDPKSGTFKKPKK
ncbi:MAG TPA: hypothetical protein VK172_08160 [Lentimicrobium sp.]|nr:hypothetical protein [Bacteroidales bacterium]HLO91122.1 hypothetical protein [Lentimicrobium sp.]